ncbi:uncharacterized protein LOC117112476 [Anneissia japonica]|uniref:uncharacterized protein LOC117112476 n=1 Tax=Anneissia japonica TaxID=1529436 RepID=UPI001425989A|nr:uncharacterized protein LOC117112476 [Anneissia japonica]
MFQSSIKEESYEHTCRKMVKTQHCRLLPLRLKVNMWKHCPNDSSWKSGFIVKCLLYFCIILQCTGTTVTNIEVRISEPPLNEVTEGEEFTLLCLIKFISFIEKRETIWFQDEMVIVSYNPQRIPPLKYSDSTPRNKFVATYVSGGELFDQFALIIKNVEISDFNVAYKCAGRDEKKTEYSNIASQPEVIEVPDPRYPLCEPRDQTFNENAEKTLKCRSESIHPAVTLRWYKNGKPLDSTTDNENDEIIQKYTFNVKYEDANAEFVCVQSSTSIPRLNGNCTIGPIYVNYIPRVTIEYRGEKNKNAMMKYNDVNILICHANTSHANLATFKWTFSRFLRPGVDYTLSDDSRFMTFTAKDEHNKLNAKCTVTNSLGSGSANITIFVTKHIKPTPLTSGPTNPDYSSQVPPSLVVAIIGICTLFIVIIMSSVLCCLKFYAHRQFINAHMRRQEIYQRHDPSIGCTIAQPEIYFEPKDSISQSTNTSDGTSSTKRSIGIQVLPQVNLELQDIHQQQTLPARYRGRPLPQPGRPNSPMVDCGCSFV